VSQAMSQPTKKHSGKWSQVLGNQTGGEYR
jgi:hypothetical protein